MSILPDGVVVMGTAGNETLSGGAGDDMLFGAAGNDILNGGGGDDTIFGGAGNDTLNGGFGDDTLLGGSGNDVVWGGLGDDTLIGESGNDTLFGGAGDDTLFGDTGNDIIHAGEGDDMLIGGLGNDYLDGGLGNDTYVFTRYSGQDIVHEDDSTPGGIDVIEMDWGLSAEDVTVKRVDNALVLAIKNSDATMTIAHWFTEDSHKIEQVQFADGTRWGVDELAKMASNITGTGGADILRGFETDDVLTGLGGNDTLMGGSGNDLLVGGAGNDTLIGGLGNDSYGFGLGDGQDIIQENDATAGNVDTVLIGAGGQAVTALNLIFSQSGNDLVVGIKGTTDQLTIKSWYAGAQCQTEVFQLNNGSTLLNTQVTGLIQAMAQLTANTGLSWSQAIQNKPNEVEAILAQYWTP